MSHAMFAMISIACLTTLIVLSQLLPKTTPATSYHTHYTKDIHLEHIKVKIFNEQGQLKQHLNAPYVTHQVQDDYTYIESPDIYLYQANQTPWHITAQKADVNDNKKVIFQSQVFIEQPETKQNQATIIETEYLVYLLDKDQLYTDHLIQLTQKNKHLQSRGMHADLTKNQIKLLAQTKAYYRPS